ncbi:MAG: hypothetical protein FWD19_03435 [Defluviitaleaceae bacterium]|nr:hypothetical protein [Defluviitaleaceae bacterium]
MKIQEFFEKIAGKDSSSPAKTRREINKSLNENLKNQLAEAHEKVREQQKKQRQQPKRRTGVTRLSNTDSMRKARQIRAQLVAKLSEVYGSDMDERSRGVSALDIKLQINKVDQQISAIRRRERALEEEKLTRRKDDTPEARRRRFRDMQENKIFIRRDYLFHADDGGYDPNNHIEAVL